MQIPGQFADLACRDWLLLGQRIEPIRQSVRLLESYFLRRGLAAISQKGRAAK
jgi:hypothetical protein